MLQGGNHTMPGAVRIQVAADRTVPEHPVGGRLEGSCHSPVAGGHHKEELLLGIPGVGSRSQVVACRSQEQGRHIREEAVRRSWAGEGHNRMGAVRRNRGQGAPCDTAPGQEDGQGQNQVGAVPHMVLEHQLAMVASPVACRALGGVPALDKPPAALDSLQRVVA